MATFPRFPDLPAEIRETIWFYCLPRRVAQLDDALTPDNRVREDQRCWSRRSFYQNLGPPVIFTVCCESRKVALRWGVIVPRYRFDRGAPTWVQPRLDTFHINWVPYYDDAFELGDEPICDFFYVASCELDKIPVSLDAENIFEFNLEPLQPILMDEYGSPSFYNQREIDSFMKYFLMMGKPYIPSLSFTLVYICIHATKAQAADSNLFGLLEDSPVQLVDYDDTDRLREFYALFEKGRFNHRRPKVAKLFASILTPAFQPRVDRWKEKADWLMMAYAWLLTKISRIPISGDPNLVWNPPLPADIDFVRMERRWIGEVNKFDEHHPWVVQAKKELPSVTPKVLFSLCTDECCVDGNIDMVNYAIRPVDHSWKNALDEVWSVWSPKLQKRH